MPKEIGSNHLQQLQNILELPMEKTKEQNNQHSQHMIQLTQRQQRKE